MRIENVDLGFKPWRTGKNKQKFSSVHDTRTGTTLHFPRQLDIPAGHRVEQRVLDFLASAPQPTPDPHPAPA